MIYRRFAQTTESISIIGFGASPLGNVFGEVSRSLDDVLVAKAIDSGINFFDVSPYYGLGLAEKRLGAALRGHRKNIFLATKCGRYGAEHFAFTAEVITRGFEDSLRRLGTDYVDLLQVHDIEFGDIDHIVDETLPALDALKQQGKVRYIGITGFWPGLLARTLERYKTDSVLNYCHANLFVNDAEDELAPLCERKGVSFLNASPLHMGLLGDGAVPSWHPAPPAVKEKATEVAAVCRRHGVSPATLATWKCLQYPFATSTLVGMADIGQVEAATQALDLEPSPELLREVDAVLAPVINVRWPQGRPENQDHSFLAAGQVTTS